MTSKEYIEHLEQQNRSLSNTLARVQQELAFLRGQEARYSSVPERPMFRQECEHVLSGAYVAAGRGAAEYVTIAPLSPEEQTYRLARWAILKIASRRVHVVNTDGQYRRFYEDPEGRRYVAAGKPLLEAVESMFGAHG